jgi:hypothetical protein
MNYAVEMGSDTFIYLPSLININFAIQKLIGETHMQTHRQQGDIISLPLLFPNEDSRLIKHKTSAIKDNKVYFTSCSSHKAPKAVRNDKQNKFM